MDMAPILAAGGSQIRLHIMEELDRRGNVTWREFKTSLNMSNDHHLASHIDKLMDAGLIRKSPHIRAYELTETGSKLIMLIDSLRGEPKRELGPKIKIILSGCLTDLDYFAVQQSLGSSAFLQLVARTSRSSIFRLAELKPDVTLEIRETGEFMAEAVVPVTSVMAVEDASALRQVEAQFNNFFVIDPVKTRLTPKDGIKEPIPSWVMMSVSLMWCMVYILLDAATKHSPQSRMQLDNYEVYM